MGFLGSYGDPAVFGVQAGLSDDPAPEKGANPLLQASWGTIQLWAKNRCLTRSLRTDGSTGDGVTWFLLPFIEWVLTNAIALLNEEPFPVLSRVDEIGDAVDWFATTESPPWTMLEDEEERWYSARSSWWGRHAFRAGFEGAAFPNVVLRRQGDSCEIAWDNEAWPAPRRDLTFIDPRGAAYVPVRSVARTLLALLDGLTGQLADRHASALSLVEAAAGLRANHQAWRWLLPSSTRDILESRPWATSVIEALRAQRCEDRIVVVPGLEGQLFRAAPAVDDGHSLQGLYRLLSRARQRRATQPIWKGRRAQPAPTREPWLPGYEAALQLRHDLGLDGEPLPDLGVFLEDQGAELVEDTPMDASIDGAVAFPANGTPVICVNPTSSRDAGWSRRMLEATQFGYLLLDASSDEDFAQASSAWTHWPSAARARAFAAMFLMPEDGVREVVVQHARVTQDTVRAIMTRFGTGFVATTWHLKNLRIISDEERLALLQHGV